jgi:hypothetical protein
MLSISFSKKLRSFPPSIYGKKVSELVQEDWYVRRNEAAIKSSVGGILATIGNLSLNPFVCMRNTGIYARKWIQRLDDESFLQPISADPGK